MERLLILSMLFIVLSLFTLLLFDALEELTEVMFNDLGTIE